MEFPFLQPPLEMWGGLECTINRVGDTYFDQLQRNGHLERLDDLQRFAELGIRTLRYPVQWERIAPDGLERADWTWIDERLSLLRSLGISPIVGLTHHGSGPRYTSLVNPSFAEGLAQFAAAVAQRYPWLKYYTPVNEPLTTARFSGLYGHWYPHGHDDVTFVRALLNQCRAVVLSMQAVRRVNPHAQLVQTEDLGKVFSTPLLAYQAEKENKRRWLSFDLLCGRLDPYHSMWNYLVSSGADEAELHWFLEHSSPPDVLGINYYPTSERFLDEHLDQYPAEFHGENGRHRYADVEVVRVHTDPPLPLGYYERMREAWQRYEIPLAITEVHLGCTREEQLRWLMEAWDASETLRQEGAQVRAITAWSLLGAYDWNSLVTRNNNFYEPGVFDVRGKLPRPTAIAHLVRTLATGQQPDHPVLAQAGWWRRQDRFFYWSHAGVAQPTSIEQQKQKVVPSRLLAIIDIDADIDTGVPSLLGRAFARLCTLRDLPYQLLTRNDIDIRDAFSVRSVLSRLNPWAIVSTIGSTFVEDTVHGVDSLRHEHVVGSAVLSDACAQSGIKLVTFSSDLVFDGTRLSPYVESDPVTPTCSWGKIQAEMEVQVLRWCPSALVVRVGPLLSPWEDAENIIDTLHLLLKEHTTGTPNRIILAPTYVPDMVHTCLDLLIDGESGIWHLTNSGTIIYADLVQTIVHNTALELRCIDEDIMQERNYIASPLISRVLQSEHGQLLPSLTEALSHYKREYKDTFKRNAG